MIIIVKEGLAILYCELLSHTNKTMRVNTHICMYLVRRCLTSVIVELRSSHAAEVVLYSLCIERPAGRVGSLGNWLVVDAVQKLHHFAHYFQLFLRVADQLLPHQHLAVLAHRLRQLSEGEVFVHFDDVVIFLRILRFLHLPDVLSQI